MLIAIDLFAGCGSLTAGLSSKFRVLAAVEKDNDASESYSANHFNTKIYRDILETSCSKIMSDLKLSIGELDLLAGCPPCQGFSSLGKRNILDSRNLLFRNYIDYVSNLEPKVCFFENVPGFMATPYFRELISCLKENYFIDFKIVNMLDYGVPQSRKRLIILASRIRKIFIPDRTHVKKKRTVSDAISGLETPPFRSEIRFVKAKIPWHYQRDISEKVRQRLQFGIDHGGNNISFPRELQLRCHLKNPGTYRDVYGVLSWDRPSGTITSGCTHASKGRFGHPEEPRAITAFEASLLQTFPKEYRFSGGLESVSRQIGNAVPKRFATIIASTVAKHLDVIDK